MKIKVTYELSEPNLREGIETELARVLQQEIDAEVMRDVFKKSGWHEVVLDPMTSELGEEIDAWVKDNIKHNEWHHGLVWLFKDDKDANWFSLRWLSSQR
jgi:hypothetical protein